MLYVVSVRDNVAKCYSEPFFVPHVGAAIRSFVDASRNERSNIFRSVKDYDLIHIADFDPSNGEICVLTDFELLCTGQSLAVVDSSTGQD
jgi:hypothetical protein